MMPTVSPDFVVCRRHGAYRIDPPLTRKETSEAEQLAIEQGIKERILDLHEEQKQHPLEWLRQEMRQLYLDRVTHDGWNSAQVNANDARFVLETAGLTTGPWMGALFRAGDWERTGQTVPSTAEGSHARILWCYRLRGRV
jgi:hypothetical protein